VENVFKVRLKNMGATDPVIVPKPVGPFSIIPMFETEMLLQVMFYALYNTLVLTDSASSAPPPAEAIRDQAIHLVMLAFISFLQDCKYGAFYVKYRHSSLSRIFSASNNA
jgi:E3 ubiquitin-protein ligase UBR1